jgi:transposase
MRKIREVLRLHHGMGAKQREIASACNIAPSSVHEYLRRAEAAGIGWPLPEDCSDKRLEELLFARHAQVGLRSTPDWKAVQRELLKKNMTLAVVWEDYKKENPDGYERSQFCHLFREWEGTTEIRMSQNHRPGERLWIDWAGQTAPLTDPETGEVSGVPVFVSTFGVSQKVFARAFPSMELEFWLEAHVRAFKFYGVLATFAVPDNTKTGVTSPNRYEPEFNLEYAEFARHYSLAVIPARVRKPRDKGKVENGVQRIEQRVLARLEGRTYLSLDELNDEISRLVDELNSRVMRGPEASRNQLFEEIDRPAARPLPKTHYEFASWKKAKVGPNHHVSFEGHGYSVPYALVGRNVAVRCTAQVVQIFEGAKVVASHPRNFQRFGYTTLREHRPKSHREYEDWTPARLVRWGSKCGGSVGKLVQAMLEAKLYPQHGYNSAFGLISLGKKHGLPRLNAACARALAAGALSYKSVKTILEKGLDQATLEFEQRPMPVHENVRGAEYYKEGSR